MQAEAAELIGIVNAFAAVQKEGLDEVVLVSDSKCTIQAINGNGNGNAAQLDWKKLFWLDQIKNSLQEFKFSLCVYLPWCFVVFCRHASVSWLIYGRR